MPRKRTTHPLDRRRIRLGLRAKDMARELRMDFGQYRKIVAAKGRISWQTARNIEERVSMTGGRIRATELMDWQEQFCPTIRRPAVPKPRPRKATASSAS